MTTGFSADMPMAPVVWSGVVQGLGLGFVFVPVSMLAYATLPAQARTEAAGLFSLSRNIGSSVGISIVFTLVARGTQVNHAELAERITPFSTAPLPAMWDPSTVQGLVALNAEVTRQAAAIAYLNDFWLMMWLTLAALPLLVLFRAPSRKAASAPMLAAAEH